MSDLISRSELLKEVEKYKFGAISNDTQREYIKSTILDFINFQPTAYDPDEIINELDKAKEKIATEEYCKNIIDTGNCENKDCFKCCAEYLINIVKQGGVRKGVNK